MRHPFKKCLKKKEAMKEELQPSKPKKFISSQTKLIWPQPMSKRKKYLLEHI